MRTLIRLALLVVVVALGGCEGGGADEDLPGLKPVSGAFEVATSRPTRIGETIFFGLVPPSAEVPGVKIERIEVVGLTSNAEVEGIWLVPDSPQHPTHSLRTTDPYPPPYPIEPIENLPPLSPDTTLSYYFGVAIQRVGPGTVSSKGVEFYFEVKGKHGKR